MSKTMVTFKAAQRRFRRSQDSKISTLSPREQQGMHGSHYALVKDNTIVASGDLGTVEQWCREVGVLHPNEAISG